MRDERGGRARRGGARAAAARTARGARATTHGAAGAARRGGTDRRAAAVRARHRQAVALRGLALTAVALAVAVSSAASSLAPGAPLQMAEAVPADEITQQLLERIRHRMPPRRTSDRTNTSTATASAAEEDRNGGAQSLHRNLSAVLTDPIEKVAHTIEAAILGVGTESGADGSGDGAAPPWSTAARRLATTGVQRSARIATLVASREVADEVLFALERDALAAAPYLRQAWSHGVEGAKAYALDAPEPPTLALYAEPGMPYPAAADAVDELLTPHSLLELVHEPAEEAFFASSEGAGASSGAQAQSSADAGHDRAGADMLGDRTWERMWLVRVAPVAPAEMVFLRTLDALHFSGNACDGPDDSSSIEAFAPFYNSGWGADLWANFAFGLVQGAYVGAPWRAVAPPQACFGKSLREYLLGTSGGVTEANVTTECSWHYARGLVAGGTGAQCPRGDSRCLFLDTSPCALPLPVDWVAQRDGVLARLNNRTSEGEDELELEREIKHRLGDLAVARKGLFDGGSERLLQTKRPGSDEGDARAGQDQAGTAHLTPGRSSSELSRIIGRLNAANWNRESADTSTLPAGFFAALAASARQAAERALRGDRIHAAAAAEATANLADRTSCDTPGCAGRLRASAYFYATRPRWRLRQEVRARSGAFLRTSGLGRADGGACAVFHARRGDIVLQENYIRRYVPLREQVAEARDFLDEAGVRTVFLLTDSQDVLDEAVDIMKTQESDARLSFVWLPKPRFSSYESGFENPFPGGNETEEAVDILTGFAVAAGAGCSVWSGGDYGNFGKLAYQLMCRGSWTRPPLAHRWRCPRMSIVQTMLDGRREVPLEYIDARVAKQDFFSKSIDWEALWAEYQRNRTAGATARGQ